MHVEEHAAVDKAFADLQARAALAGHTLSTVKCEDAPPYFVIGRWGLSRSLPDLAAVELFLRQVGVPT